MDPSPQYKNWLESFPKFNWRATFDFLLAPEALKAIEFNDYGIACFVKGLQYEFIDKNYHEAFNCYENGAMQYDPLCLFKLHEIYVGNTPFQVEYNERQSLCHLVYSALVAQFEVFDQKVSFWQKFEAFWKKDASRAAYIQDLIISPPADYFIATGPLFSKLFTFYSNKNTFLDALSDLKSLCTDALKNKFFPVLNAVFDFLAYTYNSGYSKTDLEKYVEVILDMLTNDILFDNFFHNYITHLKLLRAKQRFAITFQRRLETDCFWIWSFSFLASMKNHYLGLLLSFNDILLDGSFVLKWKNTSSWVNNFVGYCLEKGIGAPQEPSKSLQLYENDINTMPRVLFSRYRRVLLLKQNKVKEYQVNEHDDIDSYVENETKDLKMKLEERLEDNTRMDCYIYYVYGKVYEKIDEDIDTAIDWYQKGIDSNTDSCMKNHLLCNENWRLRCKKRLQKLQKRKGLQVLITNKNIED